jgi:hypothetical protein
MTVHGELQAQVVDPVAAAVKVVDYEAATRSVLQTAMRALVMKRSSAELNEGRQVNPTVADEVVDAARSWGVSASSVTFDVAVASGRKASPRGRPFDCPSGRTVRLKPTRRQGAVRVDRRSRRGELGVSAASTSSLPCHAHSVSLTRMSHAFTTPPTNTAISAGTSR